MEEKVIIDDTIQMPEMVETPIRGKGRQKKEQVPQPAGKSEATDVPCCLRNERVVVRFVPKPSEKIQNPKHVLYGGMAETATITYVVPRLSTGMYKNVLTDDEKAYLENIMGLEYNALSVYKKQDNFWDDSNDSGISKVTLRKQDNFLDLSNPEDYIKYKILLANKDYIAPSLQELEDHPKATYKFVIVSENAEAKAASQSMSVTMQCYKEYGKVEDDIDTLKMVVELLSGRPTSGKVKLDVLQSKINDYIQAQPKIFLDIITDKLLPTKVLIKKSVEAGLIGKKNDCYFLRADNTPLC